MKRLQAADDELRSEYDFKALKGGVRGNYFHAASAGANLVLIDPDLLKIFPDSESINGALRMLANTAKAAARKPAASSARKSMARG